MSDFNKQVIEEFRANGGEVGGFFADKQLLLLHTTGAKSGLPRLNPLVTFTDGDRYVIVASKGGAPTHPDWYYNLVAHPNVTVEVGSETFAAHATITSDPERSELYAKAASHYDFFIEYEKKAGRVIPVITLSRQS